MNKSRKDFQVIIFLYFLKAVVQSIDRVISRFLLREKENGRVKGPSTPLCWMDERRLCWPFRPRERVARIASRRVGWCSCTTAFFSVKHLDIICNCGLMFLNNWSLAAP